MSQYICLPTASPVPTLGINSLQEDQMSSDFPQCFAKIGSKGVNRFLAVTLGSLCASLCAHKFFSSLEQSPLKIWLVSRVFWSSLYWASGVETWTMAFSVLGALQFPSLLTLLIQRNLLSLEAGDKWDLYSYMSQPS